MRVKVPMLERDTVKIKKITLWLFAFFHIFLSLDFGHLNHSSLKYKPAIKFVTVFQASFVSVLTIGHLSQYPRSLFITFVVSWATIQYFVSSITLSLFSHNKRSFVDFQETLKAVDLKLSVDSDLYKINFKLLLFWFLGVLSKVLISTIFCYGNDDECTTTLIGSLLITMQIVSFDTFIVVFSFAFYAAYCRLRVFNEYFRNSGAQVIDALDIYISIIKSVENIKKYYDGIVSICMYDN